MFLRWRVYFAVFLATAFFAGPWIASNYSPQLQAFSRYLGDNMLQMAAVVLHNPRTIAELQSKYLAGSTKATINVNTDATLSAAGAVLPQRTSKIRILLVPGHEPNFGGTKFGQLEEREMNVKLAGYLEDYLAGDPHYEVFVTRDNDAWSQTFSDYFKQNWDEIKQWQKDSHDDMQHLLSINQETLPTSKVFHNFAPTDVALRLLGITKWANENMIDVVIHIHFNDYPGHNDSTAQKYKGFAIYVPVQQYSNSITTKAVAVSIMNRLSKVASVSNLPGESSGIVDEPDLIAIGANNTSDAASMLIEYGYVYEKQFRTADTRWPTLKELARQTFLGLQDFFTSDSGVTPGYL